MNKLIAAVLLATTALVTPGLAMAGDVTITTKMANYSGNNAYLSIYLTKPDGSYETTLWVAGSKMRYLGEMRGWVSALQQWGGQLSLDGITGASVGSGRTLTIHASIADAMIDAGYQIHVESAVEHGGQYPDDAVATVTSQPQTVRGNGYVSTLSVSM
jgi:hypothetical protein